MDTAEVYLIMDPLPAIVDTLNRSLCEDAGTPGSVAGVNLTLLNNSIDGGAGNTITWYTDAGLTTPLATPSNTTVNDNDVFYVLVDNGTCSDTAVVIYTVTSTITLNDPAPVLCEDSYGSGNVTNIDLTSYNTSVYGGTGATYTWYTDAGLTTLVGTPTNVTASNGTIFYVDVVDGTCNNNTTLSFTVNGQSVGTVDSTICNGGSVTVNGTVYSSATTLTGVEVFTAANNCDSTVTVTIIELPLITGTLDSTVCNGGSFVFNGTTYDASNPTGVETLIAASGCDSTITVTLTELPLIESQISDNICSGSSYTFPEGTATNLTADTTHISTLIAALGCDSIVTFIITVNPQLAVNPTTTDTTICISDPLTLTATGSGSGTITWFSDAAGTIAVETGTTFTPNFGSTGSYTFYVQEVGTCSSALIPVTVMVGGVTASIGALPNTGFVPLDVEFTNGSSTGLGITYTWDFGDGTSDNVFEPSHTYTEINNYIATLTVTDAAGCEATASVAIEVIGESTILIPNVFTPNGDGSNDVFMVSGTNLESVEGQILNRWGQTMFEWSHVKGYWDGRTLSGGEAPDGTYFYIISAKGIDGQEYFKKGGFSLIR
jgi:gliding motility-associated-like protein